MSFEQALKTEKIRNLSTRQAVVTGPDRSWGELIKDLQKSKMGCAVIVNSDQKVIGIFTEQDSLKRGLLGGADSKTPIEKLMTPNPTVLFMDDSIANAIRLMYDGKYRHLPIVDPEGKFLGLISVKDIVFYLAENYPYEVLNQPPDPHKISLSAEGA